MKTKDKFELLHNLNKLKYYLSDSETASPEILLIFDDSIKFKNSELTKIKQKIKEEKLNEALTLLHKYKEFINNSLFIKPCTKDWYTLKDTEDIDRKFCLDCNKSVFLVTNKKDFLKRKELSQCIAFYYDDFSLDKSDEENFNSCRIDCYGGTTTGLPI